MERPPEQIIEKFKDARYEKLLFLGDLPTYPGLLLTYLDDDTAVAQHDVYRPVELHDASVAVPL